MNRTNRTPVAIIGMACRFPGAENLDAFWDLLVRGGCSVAELPSDRFNQQLYYDPQPGVRAKSYSKIGAVLANRQFDRRRCPIDERLVQSADPVHLLMCETAAEACRHAGLDPLNLPLRNTGVFVGNTQSSELICDNLYASCIADAAPLLREVPDIAQLPDDQQQALVEELIALVRSQFAARTPETPDFSPHIVAGLIVHAFGLTGPFMAINSACASSLQAMLIGARALQLGRIDMAIVGGASDCKSDTLALFSHAQSVSATGSRPFDADADGLVCSEGYVALVLKRLDRALADGDPIHAVVRGLGISSDGRGKSLWAPRKEGQILAMQRAYFEGLEMGSLQYLEAHATSTQVGDATELNALAEILSQHLPPGRRIPIGSVKGNIGHTLESAGLASVVKTVLCLQRGVVPPAANVRQLNPKIDWQRVPFFVPLETVPWPDPGPGAPRRAGVNAFGIGGLNMHLVLEQGNVESRRTAGAASSPGAAQGGPSSNRADERLAALAAASVPPPSDIDRPAVAIIGIGCILPGAHGTEAFWNLLTSGHDPKLPVPQDRWPDRPLLVGAHEAPRPATRVGGFITDFQYDWRTHKVPPKQVAQADPLQFMLLTAADDALRDAGYGRAPAADGRDEPNGRLKSFERGRVGVIVGTEFGGDFSTQLQVGLRLPHMERVLEGMLRRRGMADERIRAITRRFGDVLLQRWPALIDETGSFTSSTLASRITKTMDLMGGAGAVDAGEASAAAALSVAVDMLLAGDCDAMFCAAGQRRMGPPSYEALVLAGCLATSDRPRSPLDQRADGYLPGEGACVLLLKRLEDARRDGDRIHAVIRGLGAAAGPTWSEALQLAAQRALRQAAVTPSDVSVVEIDGTGLPKVDREYAQALRAVYAATDRREPLRVGSVIAQIGHTGGASAAVSVIKAALEIERGHVPAILGLVDPLVELTDQPQRLQAATTAAPLRAASADGRQFASVVSTSKRHAYHIVLERATRVPAEMPPTAPALPTQTDQLPAGRPAMRVAMLFPGQGSQYRGMMRGLVDAVPAAAAKLDEIDAALAHHGYETFRRMAWEDGSQLGRDIWITQISTLCANLIAHAALAGVGIRPGVVAGHSYGEYAALAAAGVWTVDEVIAIARARYEGIEQTPSARGAMLATTAPAEIVEEMIRRFDGRVYLANHNAPDQTVLGGEREELTRFATLLSQQSYVAQMLAVPCAFHTPLMQGAGALLERVLATSLVRPPGVPVLSSVNNRYVADPDEIRANLVAQLTTPVRYVDLVRRLVADQPAVLVEVGPQQVLTKLNRRILGMEHPAIAVDDPKRPAHEVLGELGELLERAGAIEQADATPTARRDSATARLWTPVHYDATSVRRGKMREAAAAAPARTATAAAPARATTAAAPDTALCDANTRQRGAVPASGNNGGHAANGPTHLTDVALLDSPTMQTSPRPMRTAGEEPGRYFDGNGNNGAQPPAAQPAARRAPPDLQKFLIEFVVDQTGYPPEVVDLDADLEADLGIDSIKKAQMLAELQPYFDVRPGDDVSLDDFPTLRHVIDFLKTSADRTPAAEPAAAVASPPVRNRLPATTYGETSFVESDGASPRQSVASSHAAAPPTARRQTIATAQLWPPPAQQERSAAPSDRLLLHTPGDEARDGRPGIDDLESFLIQFVVEQTGYPPEVVDLDADLEADLGIDSIKKAQMLAELRPYFDVRVTDDLSLDDFPTLRHVIDFLSGSQPARHRYESNGPVAVVPKSAASPARSELSPPAPPVDAASPPTLADLPAASADTSAARQRGVALGRQHCQSIRQALRRRADRGGVDLERLLADDCLRDNPSRLFTPEECDELHGIADGAGVSPESIIAHVVGLVADRGGADSHLDGEPVDSMFAEIAAAVAERLGQTQAEERVPQADHRDAASRITQRLVLRMLDRPWRGEPDPGRLDGTVMIVGRNRVAELVADRLSAAGVDVIRMGGDSLAAAKARLGSGTTASTVRQLILATSWDDEAETPAGDARRIAQRNALLTELTALCQIWLNELVRAGRCEGATLAAITALGGDFGVCGELRAIEGGAMTGLVKGLFVESSHQPWRGLRCKAIDLDPRLAASAAAEAVYRELATDEPDVEVAFAAPAGPPRADQRDATAALRRVVRVVALSGSDGANAPRSSIRRGGTWIVTGGARGITAAVAIELGRRYGLKLHLLGTSPPPRIDPAWRDLMPDGLQELKASILRSARAEGQPPAQAWHQVERALEIDRTLRRMEASGVTATYHGCDISRPEQLQTALDAIRRTDGPIDGILHGAAFVKDAWFTRKLPDHVQRTLDVKTAGAALLAELTRDDPVRHFIAFSSITGRFGARGQVDYGMANDMLAKQMARLRRDRPGCAAVAIHWHPWDEIGMAASSELRAMFESMGMRLMPPAEGIAWLIDELEAGLPEAEVVFTQQEYYKRPYAVEVVAEPHEVQPPGTAIGQSEETARRLGDRLELACLERICEHEPGVRALAEVRFDPAVDPFLIHHRIGGHPFLPAVIGLEALAEAAALVDGRRVLGFRQVAVQNGLQFGAQAPIAALVEAAVSGDVAQCRLTTELYGRTGRLIDPSRVHVEGEVVLCRQSGAPPVAATCPDPGERVWYPTVFPDNALMYHGPPLRCLSRLSFNPTDGFGEIVAPDDHDLLWGNRPGQTQIVPAAVLDACLMACGVFAWVRDPSRTEIPLKFRNLWLLEQPRPGERMLLYLRAIASSAKTGTYQFTLFGDDGRLILWAEEYRSMALVSAS